MNLSNLISAIRAIPSRLGKASILSLAFTASLLSSHAETDPSQGRLITSLAIAVNTVTHKVYGVNEPGNSVSVFDEQTGLTHAVKVGTGPVSLAIDSRTNRIYVVNTGSNSISVIEGKQDKVIATIQERTGSNPYVVAVDEATNKIYVTNTYNSALTVIDGATNASHALHTGSADGIAIDPRTHTIFLMTYEDPKIRMVNTITSAVSTVNVGPHLWGMAFDQAQATLYVAHTMTNNIVALQENTHAVSDIAVGAIPCAIALNPVTQRLYAVNYGDQTLSVISAQNHKVLATISVGKHPQAVAIDSRRNLVYVANVHGNTVTLIDGKTDRVLATLPAGKNPYALAIDQKTGLAFAADYGKPIITAISISKRATHAPTQKQTER